MKLKCRKCRQGLLESKCLLTSHGETNINFTDESDLTCADDRKESNWYINYDIAPDWMKGDFDQGNWVKGKISCPKCTGRLGAFNFTQPRKCACRGGVAQPVWLLKSRVDFDKQLCSVDQKKNVFRQVTVDSTWTVMDEQVQQNISVVDRNILINIDVESHLLNSGEDKIDTINLETIT